MEPKFVWRGNHPALDFMNTQIMNKGQVKELLLSYEDVLEWLRDSGYLSRIEGTEELADGEKRAVFLEILAVRSELNGIVERLVQGESAVGHEAVERLNRLLKDNAGYTQLARIDGGVREEMHYAARRMAGFFLEQTVRLLADLEPGRIKKCSNAKCILHFYDNSRNSSRRWCDATGCGNRENASQHYRRKKAAAQAD